MSEATINSHTKSSSPDSLQVLIRKTKAICTVNVESLNFIQSRKDQQVVTHRKYVLQPKRSLEKRRKISGSSSSPNDVTLDNELVLTSQDVTKSANTIIGNWTYKGEKLKKEHIAIKTFINRKLNSFKDLLRLQREYDSLIDAYSKLLLDRPESRKAVRYILGNVEILQVGIGDLHKQVIDVRNEVEGNKEIEECMGLFTKGIEKMKASRVSFTIDVKEITKDFETNIFGIPEFRDITRIKCQHTLSDNEIIERREVMELEPYTIDGVQYVASRYSSNSNSVVLWNMVNLSKVGTLSNSSSGYAESLASFEKDDLHILAVGYYIGDIKMWNLVSREVICTLTGHNGNVLTMQVVENDEKMYLISGGWDETVSVWDLDSYSMLESLECGVGSIDALQTFAKDDKNYVAVSGDKGVELWCLTQYIKVGKLDDNYCYALAVTKHNGCLMLAGFVKDEIKVWNLDAFQEQYKYSSHGVYISSLEWITSNDKLCIVIGSNEGNMKVWEMESKRFISSIDSDSDIYAIRVIERDGHACLLTGDENEKIKLWEESSIDL